MRLSTYIAAVSTLLFAAVTTIAWRQYEQVVALRAQTLDPASRSALEARLAAMLKRNQELEARLAAMGPKAGAAKDGSGPAGAKAALANAIAQEQANGMSRREAELDLLSAMSDLPEFQKLVAVEQRGAIAQKYADLFRRLHLSPAQQDQLVQLLSDRQSAYADALLAAHDQGLTGKDARLAALQVARATDQQINSSIQSLLGPDGYKQYQNYERTAPERAAVAQLAQRLSYTGTPLSPHQQDQLVQALVTGQRVDLRASAATNGGKPLASLRVIPPLPGALGGLGIGTAKEAAITPTAVVKAQNFLRPQQVQALQQMQQEQQAQLALGQMLRAGAVDAGLKPAKGGKG